LAVATCLEIDERDDFDKVEAGQRFFTANLTHRSIELAPNVHGHPAQLFLLIVACGSTVHTVACESSRHAPVSAATLAADQPVQGGARPFAFSLFAIDAAAHFAVGPPDSGFGGGGTNP